jgi:thymidine kinase
MHKPELNIYIGSMFSGKTSKLISIYNSLLSDNIDTLVITHSLENRFGEKYISTHDNIRISGNQISNISDIHSLSSFENATVILIDESQFFPDLNNVLELVEKYNKHVYVFGLDGDFKRNKFGQILDLIPYCDNIQKLKSICYKCKDKDKGIFSRRITDSDTQLLVGSNDYYQPLCRQCYIQ